MKYKDYLKTEHWKAISKQAKENADNRCQLCNSGGELHTHHRTYDRVGKEKISDLICLCANCHKKFHDEAQEVNYIEPPSNVEKLINEVKDTLMEFDFYGMQYFAYWASYVSQHAEIYKQCNDYGFQKTAKEACPCNTAQAIQEAVWYSDGDFEIKNELRDLSFLPLRKSDSVDF